MPGESAPSPPRVRLTRGWRKARAALLLGLVPGIAGILLLRWPRAEGLEYSALDFLFQLRGPRTPSSQVCVVAIDEDSYKLLGEGEAAGGGEDADPRMPRPEPGHPWPRALHASLIRTLKREGARAVAFDVLFDTPGDPDQDSTFESALRETGIVVLGSDVEWVADPKFHERVPDDPIDRFASAAAAVGRVGLPEPRNGVIYASWPFQDGEPSLPVAALGVATGRKSAPDDRLRFIDFYGPARSVTTLSYYQALAPERYLPPGFFKDKIVFVGLSMRVASGPQGKDSFRTPFRGSDQMATYGVEIHATIAANLLENRRVEPLAPVPGAILLLLLPLASCLIFIALRPAAGAASMLVLGLVPWVVGYLAFSKLQVWIPVMIPCVVQIPAAYMLSLVWYYVTTVREREKIRRAFSFYLSPEMIGRIAADPSSLNLGGEEVVATALFTDVKGFTTIAEALPAQRTAALLNVYFSEVSRHIFDEGGTLIKFIGDAVFAIWGAPVRTEDHATRACRAALAIARAQERPIDEGHGSAPRLVTRIGVHTGSMVVGNLGSEQRFDYTAIGDAVNLASRLEGLNKHLGTLALASRATLERTDGRFVTRRLGRMRVVGKTEPVEIHELLGSKGEPIRLTAGPIGIFEQAVDDFAARRFEAAAEGFRGVIEASGGDAASELYLKEIERLASSPPAHDWDGSLVIESK